MRGLTIVCGTSALGASNAAGWGRGRPSRRAICNSHPSRQLGRSLCAWVCEGKKGKEGKGKDKGKGAIGSTRRRQERRGRVSIDRKEKEKEKEGGGVCS